MREIILSIFVLLSGTGVLAGVLLQDDRQPGTRPPEGGCKTAFDCADGVVKVGDRVIYFTDDDADGFFEKNPAIVADDINSTAKINGSITHGNLVNLWVFPSASTSRASPFLIRNAKRGRSIGQYEALANSNF